MSLNIKDIAVSIQARFNGASKQEAIDNVSIDSRSLQNNSGTLFFALTGQNSDGHLYIPDLIKKGVTCFVVTPYNYHNW